MVDGEKGLVSTYVNAMHLL